MQTRNYHLSLQAIGWVGGTMVGIMVDWNKPWLQTVEIKIEFELLWWDSSQNLACRHQILLHLYFREHVIAFLMIQPN